MATTQRALPAGRPARKRAFFGFFDADGWAWASTKAFLWLLVIILTLGYIPDRAYYFVVSKTMDLGLIGWSPVNLCPPENTPSMPCPVPVGGVLPWQPSPAGVALPAARQGGVAAQLGTTLLYIGGSDGKAATKTTYRTTLDKANFSAWTEGPALPDARTDASMVILSGTIYLIGGTGADGKPANTVWSLGRSADTGALGTWTVVNKADKSPLTLPAARSSAMAVAVTDGIVLAGGRGPDGKPTATVWKSTTDKNGVLGEFKEQPPLSYAVADASISFEGAYIWIYGGSDAHGPVGGARCSSGHAGARRGARLGDEQHLQPAGSSDRRGRLLVERRPVPRRRLRWVCRTP
jgi:hypothetical protein